MDVHGKALGPGLYLYSDTLCLALFNCTSLLVFPKPHGAIKALSRNTSREPFFEGKQPLDVTSCVVKFGNVAMAVLVERAARKSSNSFLGAFEKSRKLEYLGLTHTGCAVKDARATGFKTTTSESLVGVHKTAHDESPLSRPRLNS